MKGPTFLRARPSRLLAILAILIATFTRLAPALSLRPEGSLAHPLSSGFGLRLAPWQRRSVDALQRSQTALGALEVGSEVVGKVTSIEGKFANVEIEGKATARIHVAEVSHDFVNSIGDVLKPGDEVRGWVKKLSTPKGLELTLKDKVKGRQLISQLSQGSQVTAKVTGLNPRLGAFVDIGAVSDARIHIDEFSGNSVAEKAKSMESELKVDDEVQVLLVEVDAARGHVTAKIVK